MTLIDGDKIVTAQLYDDEYEDFIEEKMSIIDYINAYTDEGVTTADNVLDKIKSIVEEWKADTWTDNFSYECMSKIAEIIDKAESEEEDFDKINLKAVEDGNEY